MASAVVNILVNVTKVVKGTKARDAFMIAKGLNGIFRKGANALDTDSPYLEESEAVELMNEILAGIDTLTTRFQAAFEYFKQRSSANMATNIEKLLEYCQDFTRNPDDKELLTTMLTSGSPTLSFLLYDFQTDLDCMQRFGSEVSTGIRHLCTYCLENASVDDFTWGFESSCDIFAAMLALTRVSIEVQRRAMLKGYETETTGEIFGVPFQTKWHKTYTQEQVDTGESERFKRLDQNVTSFFGTTSDFWNRQVGQVIKFDGIDLPVHDSPNSAVSHRGELFWSSWFEGKLQKFANGSYHEANYDLTLRHMHPMVSHNGKLYCLSESGELYEIDPELGKATKLLHHMTFKNCVSMVGLGRYLFLTLNTFLYNIYRIDTRDKSYTCLGSDWSGGMLATTDSKKYIIYARYKHFLWDDLYTMDCPLLDSSSTTVSRLWSGSGRANIVGHGTHLYTQGKDGNVYAVRTTDFSSNNITREHNTAQPSASIVPLVSHKLSIVCKHFDNKRTPAHDTQQPSCHLAIVRPYWVDPPEDWYQKLQSE